MAAGHLDTSAEHIVGAYPKSRSHKPLHTLAHSESIWERRNYQCMPRTMLRYAIEKFPENLRQQYLKGNMR